MSLSWERLTYLSSKAIRGMKWASSFSKSLISHPLFFLTTSVAPSDLSPIGIFARQCNKGGCLENVVQHYWSRNAMICLQSPPPQSEIVRIGALYFELTYGEE